MAFEAPGLALYRCKTELDSFSFAKGRKNHILSGKTVFIFFFKGILHMMAVKNLWNSEVVCFTFKSHREKKPTQDEELSM